MRTCEYLRCKYVNEGISGGFATVNIILGPGGGRMCSLYGFSMSLLYSATSKTPPHYSSLSKPVLTTPTNSGIVWWKHFKGGGPCSWAHSLDATDLNLKPETLRLPPAVPAHSVQVDNILLITSTQEITRVSTMTNALFLFVQGQVRTDLSKMPGKGGLVTGNSRTIESEATGDDCLGFRDGGPMGRCECVNQTTLFSFRHRHTCRAHTHTHTRQFGIQGAIRLQSNRSNQLISFTIFFFLRLSPGGTRSSPHPVVI